MTDVLIYDNKSKLANKVLSTIKHMISSFYSLFNIVDLSSILKPVSKDIIPFTSFLIYYADSSNVLSYLFILSSYFFCSPTSTFFSFLSFNFCRRGFFDGGYGI